MVEEERYCVDILTQVRAARAALRRVEESVLREHVEHCVATGHSQRQPGRAEGEGGRTPRRGGAILGADGGDHERRRNEDHPGASRLGPAETDPVCGMKVDPATARGGSHEHAGKDHWFCNPRCRERFAADPEHWLKAGPSRGRRWAPPAPRPSRSPPPPARGSSPALRGGTSTSARWIRRSSRRSRAPARSVAWRSSRGRSLADGEEPRARGHDPPVLGLPGPDGAAVRPRHGRHAARAPRPPLRLAGRAGLDRAAPGDARRALGRAGRSSRGCGSSFRTGHLNMFTLIGIGTGIAWLYSLAAGSCRRLPRLLPRPRRRGGPLLRGGGGHRHPRAARPGARAAGAPAHERRDQRAARPRPEDGAPPRRGRLRGTTCPLEDVRPGDRLRVRPGEKVPVDGVVLEGASERRRVDGHGRAGAGREGGRARA